MDFSWQISFCTVQHNLNSKFKVPKKYSHAIKLFPNASSLKAVYLFFASHKVIYYIVDGSKMTQSDIEGNKSSGYKCNKIIKGNVTITCSLEEREIFTVSVNT